MTRYAVALGSNLGDRIGYLREAVVALTQLGEVRGISSLYETEPVGGPDQGPYLNAVVVVECSLEPEEMLRRLHDIEAAAGRQRAVRWGSRNLDLDIVASDTGPVRTPDLQIPHPRAGQRRFVLEPLADVWADAEVEEGRTATEALVSVADQPVDRLATRWADPSATPPGRYWVAAQFVWFLVIALVMAIEGSLPGENPEGTRVVGGVLVVVGGLLAFLSMRKLGRSITAVPEPVAGGDLIESGPYALARHPIYGGVGMLLLGTSLVVDSPWGAFLSLGLLGFFWMKSAYEERVLRIAYPDYRGYQQRVTRRLIPFVI